MTREQFVKYRFKAYQQIEYRVPKRESIFCMLVGVNFDTELMTLYPLDQEYYEDENFQAPIQHCFISITLHKK